MKKHRSGEDAIFSVVLTARSASGGFWQVFVSVFFYGELNCGLSLQGRMVSQ